MNNKQIAKRLANLMYRSKNEDSDDFAVQLFVEKTVLPDSVIEYTKEEIENRINEYLKNI